MAETDAVKTAQWIQWLDIDTQLGEDGSVGRRCGAPRPSN